MSESKLFGRACNRLIGMAGVGIAFGFVGYLALNEVSGTNPEAHNRAVATCAIELGAVATHDVALPEGCAPFARVLAERNGTTDHIMPDGARTITYNTLPSGDVFVAAEMIPPKEAASKQNALRFISGMFGVGAMVATASLSRENRRVDELTRLD